MSYYPIKVEDRFWGKVEKTSTCWNWKASLSKDGYGEISDNGIMRLAHRVSWELHNGKIPENMCVLHHCDNRKCVNPSHLFLGTNYDNVRDCINKNRAKKARGENVKTSKLNESDVINIRKLYSSGNYTFAEIAKGYGVKYNAISRIVKRASWKHVD